MTSAAFKATKVYEACQVTIESPRYKDHPEKLERLRVIADLAADAEIIGDGTVTISLDDHALLHGHWLKEDDDVPAKAA